MRLNEEQKRLVEDHHGLIYYGIHHVLEEVKQEDIDKYYGIAAIELCRAAYYWEEGRGKKFSSFAISIIKQKLIQSIIEEKTLVKEKINASTISYYTYLKDLDGEKLTLLDTLSSMDSTEELAEKKILIENAKAILTNRQREVVEMHMEGYSFVEIGKKLNRTRQCMKQTFDLAKERMLLEILTGREGR